MNAFREAQKVEAVAMQRLEPWLQDVSYKGRFVKTTKGSLSRILQEIAGDVIVNITDDHIVGVELKSERDSSPNMFVEVWSNRARKNPGWAYKLQCDFLLYYFISSDRLIISHWPSLKAWLRVRLPSGRQQINVFHLVDQKRYQQHNDTWGRLVPIAEVLRHTPARETSIRQLHLFGEHRQEAVDFVRREVRNG